MNVRGGAGTHEAVPGRRAWIAPLATALVAAGLVILFHSMPAAGADRFAGLTVLDLVREMERTRPRAVRRARAVEVPVPALTIYPGQVITADMLRMRRYHPDDVDGRYVTDSRALIGRMAARTLVRNRPVPPSAVTAPWVVRRGKAVRLIFRAGGLEITALGTALDNAAAGETVAVRNVDSGRVVYGIAQADGTVRIAAQ